MNPIDTSAPYVSSWFCTPERIASLEFKAGKWIGTPFFANSSVPGPAGGVSCQKLVSAIYQEVGFCEIEVPEAPMTHSVFSRRSLVEEFMATRPEFERLEGVNDLAAGDLLGLLVGRVVHHVGIWLSEGFIHARRGPGTVCNGLRDVADSHGTWRSKLRVVWRPLLLSPESRVQSPKSMEENA